MMAPSFSDADDEILVEEVANHPSLWQLSNAFYKDLRLKDNIWAEIANKVGKPSKSCSFFKYLQLLLIFTFIICTGKFTEKKHLIMKKF